MKTNQPSSSSRGAMDFEAPPHERRRRARVFQALVIGSILLFGLLAVLARGAAYFAIDLLITQFLQGFEPAWLGAIMRAVSWPGYMPQAALLGLLAALVLLGLRLRWEAAMLAFSAGGATALNAAVKLTIQRPRPSADLVEVYRAVESYSFPSGHVMYYTALFGFLAFLAFILLRQARLRIALVALLTLPAALVGLSRIYLGEHWASDVLAGYLLSSVWLGLAVRVYRWGKGRFLVTRDPP